MAKKYGETGNGESYKYYQRKLRLLELPKEIQNKIGTTSSQLTEYHALPICKLLNKDKLQKKFEEMYHICYKTCRHKFLIFVKTIPYYDN